MLSGERVFGLLVVESRSRSPAVVCVARNAVIRELSAMLIGVTIEACGSQTKKRPLFINMVAILRQVVADEINLVTVPAPEIVVFSHEFEPGLRVVEVINATRPVDELEVATGVFDVAFVALFHTFADEPIVISLLPVDAGRDLLVTSQAFFCVGTLAELVAFEAITYAFEERVWLR
jgi:hypothetical protein